MFGKGLHGSSRSHLQKGAALIVVLALLTISLMVGLSSMQSSQIDERLAGNYRAQSEAQMGAEEAASVGWEAIDGVGNDDWVKLSDLTDYGPESLTWDDLKDGDSGACELPITCFYRYIEDGSDKYIVAMGSVEDAGVAVSEPVVVKLNSLLSYGGASAALSVFGGIKDINESNWYPTSANAKIHGGDFGDDGDSLYSLYYEGAEFGVEDADNIANKDVFPNGFDYGGDDDDFKASSMEWLGKLFSIADGKQDVDGVVYSASDMNFVKKKDACESYQFAVIESFNVSGNKKFCGVMVHLGASLSLGGTAAVEGLVLAANPKLKTIDGEEFFDFSKPSDMVDFYVSGGGATGSVYFNETVVDEAFDLIGEDYLDYLGSKGGERSTIGFTIDFWR